MRPYRLRIGNLPIYLRGKARFSDMNVGVSGQIYKNESQDAIARRNYIVIALERGVSNKCLLNMYREQLQELDARCKAECIDELNRHNPLEYKTQHDRDKCAYFLIRKDDVHREYIDSIPEILWQPYRPESPCSHPQKKGKYLCTIDMKDGTKRFVTELAWLEYDEGQFDWEMHIAEWVVAWSPLPAPYERTLKR